MTENDQLIRAQFEIYGLRVLLGSSITGQAQLIGGDPDKALAKIGDMLRNTIKSIKADGKDATGTTIDISTHMQMAATAALETTLIQARKQMRLSPEKRQGH